MVFRFPEEDARVILSLRAVTVDTTDPARLADLWAGLLGWRRSREGDAEAAVLDDGGPRCFCASRRRTSPSGVNQTHLELTSTSAEHQQESVERWTGRSASVPLTSTSAGPGTRATSCSRIQRAKSSAPTLRTQDGLDRGRSRVAFESDAEGRQFRRAEVSHQSLSILFEKRPVRRRYNSSLSVVGKIDHKLHALPAVCVHPRRGRLGKVETRIGFAIELIAEKSAGRQSSSQGDTDFLGFSGSNEQIEGMTADEPFALLFSHGHRHIDFVPRHVPIPCLDHGPRLFSV